MVNWDELLQNICQVCRHGEWFREEVRIAIGYTEYSISEMCSFKPPPIQLDAVVKVVFMSQPMDRVPNSRSENI